MSWLLHVWILNSILDRGTRSFTRRSCQTVLAEHLLSIVRVIAPILPHLAEDVWQNLPFQYRKEDGSVVEFVFESRWPALNQTWLSFPTEDVEHWEKVLEVITINSPTELFILVWFFLSDLNWKHFLRS